MENEVLEQPDILVCLQDEKTGFSANEVMDELIPLDEFKKHFEKRIFERLGLEVSL